MLAIGGILGKEEGAQPGSAAPQPQERQWHEIVGIETGSLHEFVGPAVRLAHSSNECNPVLMKVLDQQEIAALIIDLAVQQGAPVGRNAQAQIDRF